jgi:hypothetical protein
VSEGDHEAKQEAKRRLSEPEGDHELRFAMEHMKEHHPHLWNALHRVDVGVTSTPPSSMRGGGRPKVARRTTW